MFGGAKSMWNKINPSDENNVQLGIAFVWLKTDRGGRLILVDTGMGGKQDEKCWALMHGDDTWKI
jgi:hypothetical protein